MPDGLTVICAIAFVVLVGGGVALDVRDRFFNASARMSRRVKRAMGKATVLPIASAREGAVIRIDGELRGSASDEDLLAPVSDKPCVVFALLFERRPNARRASWSPVQHGCGGADFIVEDGSGIRAIVSTEAMDLAVVGKSEARWVPNAAVPDLLNAVDSYIEGALDESVSFRVTESLLVEGAQVSAIGIASWEPDPEGSAESHFRETPRRLRLRAPRDGVVSVMDAKL